MLRKLAVWAVVLIVAASAQVSEAQSLFLQAFSSFGGDGWLSPTEAGGTLSVTNQVRSLAFDPSTTTLLIPSGANTVQRINATTGAYEGSAFNNSGVSGGTVLLNTVAATSDGVIYGSNLTTNSTTSPFKVYRWTSGTAAPTVSYSGNGGLAGVRLGDNIAVTGADASGLLGFGYGTTSNGFGIITTGSAGTATGVTFATGTTNPAVGQFRLGMAFVSPSSVLGTQNSSILANATYTGSAATLISSGTLASGGSQRGVSYAVVDGVPVLATIDTGNNAVRLYDATNLASPVLLSTLNLTTSASANANATAQVVFGSVGGQTVLYALNSNNGIQAFSIVPEPASLALAAVAAAGFGFAGLRRRGFFRRRG